MPMLVSKPYHRLILFATFIASILLVSHLLCGRSDEDGSFTHTHAVPREQKVYTTPDVKDSTPKITVIAIWSHHSDAEARLRKEADEAQGNATLAKERFRFGAGNTAHYMPFFFQSVEANPEVDLLFIDVDRDTNEHGPRCTTYSTASNVKHVCLSEREYYELHADFLCKRWHCAGEDRELLIQKFTSERDGDRSNSFFRTLRSGIFAKWIDPATTIWGWCDSDTYWGSFARNFPWDVAHDFEIIAPTSYPTFGDQHLLFTRGHLAFFRHSDEVLDRLHDFPHFASLGSYLLTPQVEVAAEESEFSQYYFNHNTNFTYMTIESMVDTTNMLAILSELGVFYAFNRPQSTITSETRSTIVSLIHADPPPSASVNTAQLQPTFSTAGSEKEITLLQEGYRDHIWFPERFATYLEPGYSHDDLRDNKLFVMRREAGGPTTVRLEPRGRHMRIPEDRSINIGEGLYKHYQGEKRLPWFYQVPLPVGGRLYVQYGVEEGQLWGDNGDILIAAK